MSEDIENEVVETVYSKGLNLEKEFSEFMKSDLGWHSFKIRKQMTSKWNKAGTNVDIFAERLNEHGLHLKRTGKAYFMVSWVIMIIGVFIVGLRYDTQGIIVTIMGLLFLIGSYFFTEIGTSKEKEHAWVECKNLKQKATIKQMQIMLAERDAYIESQDKEYKIVETYFVSTNGFVETALKYGIDKNVKCYIRQDNTFKEKGYWDND
jgi:hypothetical protein